MTAPEDNQIPESQLSPEAVAQQRLIDLGLAKTETADDSYRWSIDWIAMTDAVKVIRNHASRLPVDIQADLELKFFKLCKDMDSFTNMWSPAMREAAKRQLLSEEEEQKRHKQALTERMQAIKAAEQLDMIMDTDPPPEAATAPGSVPIASREDLTNMALQLQVQIKRLESKIYELEEKINVIHNRRSN
jgi:hypothetical protein